MFPICLLIAATVLAVLWRCYRAQGGRPLAELLVDWLYVAAFRAAAIARAADCALLAYRLERDQLNRGHSPEYGR